jgi:hypothetical protein
VSLLLALVACSPVLELSTQTLDLGAVARGESAQATLVATNAGPGPLELELVELSDPLLWSVDVSGPLTLAAGEDLPLEVRFEPAYRGLVQAQLLIAASDGEHRVDLLGQGLAPELSMDPEALDFGAVSLGQTAQLAVTLGNTGDAILRLESVEVLPGSAFSAKNIENLDALAPGEAFEVEVLFQPSEVGPAEDALWVLSDDPDGLEQSVSLLGEGLGPDIEVDALSLDFGEADAGERVELQLGISNLGLGTLVLEPERFELEAPFELVELGSEALEQDESTTLTLAFVPEGPGSAEGELVLVSNDASDPTLVVELLGEGHGPLAQLDPEAYDFGTLYIGCDQLQPVEVSNVGDRDLQVTMSLVTDSDDFSGEGGSWLVPPGESAELWVLYAPLDELDDSAEVLVESDDLTSPELSATLLGRGELYGSESQVETVEGTSSADIVFAVNGTSSMSDELSLLEASILDLSDELEADGVDYRIGAVVADSGCVAGSTPYLDDSLSSSEREDAWAEMLAEDAGSDAERPFMLLTSALASSNTGTGGCNEGLYRESAALHLVGVSDEPDQSVNPYTYYVSLFQSLDADVALHAIGGDYPTSACGTADVFTGFYEATVATGGSFTSLCNSSFSSNMQAIAAAVTLGSSSFELDDWPVPETLQVFVGGTELTEGWSYDAASNTVSLDESPEDGTEVRFDFAIYGDCDA